MAKKQRFTEDKEVAANETGLLHRTSLDQFRENLRNAGPAPVSIPDRAARDKWLSEREKIVPNVPTKFTK